MGNRSELGEKLSDLLTDYRKSNIDRQLRRFVLTNSGLPGPRGNIELALAFSDVLRASDPGHLLQSLELCLSWAQLDADAAPVDEPAVMVPFCGVVGSAGVAILARSVRNASTPNVIYDRAVDCAWGAAGDPRWRIREGCAMALQQLIFTADTDMLDRLEAMVPNAGWLELRAAVATVADHGLRGRRAIAERALDLHRRIFDRVGAESALRVRGGRPKAARFDDGFDVLVQALGFSMSVVVAELPADGFKLLRDLARSRQPAIRRIVGENLKKKRLSGPYPEEVAAIRAELDGSSDTI